MTSEKLTNDNFEYVHYSNAYKPPDNILFITCNIYNKIFRPFSPIIHKCFIKHNIRKIENKAPSLDAYWKRLMVCREDVMTYNVSEPLKLRDPVEKFFIQANQDFEQYSNKELRRKSGKKLYLYKEDPNTHKVLKYSIREAKILYGRLFQQTTLSKHSESEMLFNALSKVVDHYVDNNENPKIIVGVKLRKNLDSLSFESMLENDSMDAIPELYLVEMLIHRHDLNECYWNVV